MTVPGLTAAAGARVGDGEGVVLPRDAGTAPIGVLHVVAPAPFGGLESVVRMLAVGHRRRGHRVHVAAVLSPGEEPAEHPFVHALRAEGVPVTPLVIGDREYRAERAGIERLCTTLEVEALHTHGFRPDVVDGRVARRLGLRTVSTVHSFIGRSRRARVYEWLQRRALRRFDAVVAVSAAIERRLLAAGMDRARLHLLPNAFAPRADLLGRAEARARLEVSDERTRVVGWVGRLSAEKGADVALRAVAACEVRDVELAMLGAGPEGESLRRLAASLGIARRVRWYGAVPDAGALFAGFDAFLLSSRTEGTPVALLEAMAARVPVIATRVGGVPDVVGAGEGWLAPSEDAEAIGAALADRFARPDVARERAAAARARLDRQFALDPWLARYEALYRPSVLHESVVRR